MKTFHILPRYKIIYLVVILLFLGLIGFLASTFIDIATFLRRNTFERTISALGLPLACSTLFLLLATWFGVYIAAFRKMRLIFDDKKITLESIMHFQFLLPAGYKSFEISYDQIEKVKYEGFNNRMILIDQKRKEVVLFPALFSKNYGEEVLTELRNHLPIESFEPSMETSAVLGMWSKQIKIRITIAVFYIVPFIATYFFDPQLASRSWLTNDWQVKLNPWGYESVWSYSVDSQNTFWVVSWRSSYYRVYHFSDKLENEWKLPKELLGRQYPQQISNDSKGSPIIWADHAVYIYEGKDWKQVLYPNSLTLENWNSQSIAFGEQAWVINSQNQILKINALTGIWSVIDLPESALVQKLQPKSMRWANHSDILVLMQNDSTRRIYLLSPDDLWKSQEYDVVSSQEIRVLDYFLDDQDSLWVLSEEGNQFFVQKVNLSGAVLQTQLSSPKEADEWERYSNLIVDSSERLWVEGSYPGFMAVFHPVWNNVAEEIVRYTAANSEYQGGKASILLPDGKIWSFDERLSTIDTHLTVLPSPLPAWFASWDWGLIRLSVILAQLPIQLFFYFMPPKSMLFRKKY